MTEHICAISQPGPCLAAIEFTEDGVQVQVNDNWCDAEVIGEQGDLLFVEVDLPNGDTSLQTWQSDENGDYTVVGSGICDIVLP
ncbi:MAG: hypothetical protein E6Q97_25475 [Desulfurellales bacterium]|nr:MAG: hypothetical protein E6Q97_25475 [Desulfurellales bacterium]